MYVLHVSGVEIQSHTSCAYVCISNPPSAYVHMCMYCLYLYVSVFASVSYTIIFILIHTIHTHTYNIHTKQTYIQYTYRYKQIHTHRCMFLWYMIIHTHTDHTYTYNITYTYIQIHMDTCTYAHSSNRVGGGFCMRTAAPEDPKERRQPARSSWMGLDAGLLSVHRARWAYWGHHGPDLNPPDACARSGAPKRVWGGVPDGGEKRLGTCPGSPWVGPGVAGPGAGRFGTLWLLKSLSGPIPAIHSHTAEIWSSYIHIHTIHTHTYIKYRYNTDTCIFSEYMHIHTDTYICTWNSHM